MSAKSKKKYHILEDVAGPEKPFPVPFPEEGSVYDYRFLKEANGRWEAWAEKINEAPPIPKVLMTTSKLATCCFVVTHTVRVGWLEGRVC